MYLVRMAPECLDADMYIEEPEKKYEKSGKYRSIYAKSFEEAIKKWNDCEDCPEELKREWGECGLNESLVIVINRKGQAKCYM